MGRCRASKNCPAQAPVHLEGGALSLAGSRGVVEPKFLSVPFVPSVGTTKGKGFVFFLISMPSRDRFANKSGIVEHGPRRLVCQFIVGEFAGGRDIAHKVAIRQASIASMLEGHGKPLSSSRQEGGRGHLLEAPFS
mmetsp:Transcript_87154/g.182389  ORF Transcript_87154/g.182389 Transcript_87154/m.182389 type:complete len:136 (+) Transcript_87154:205-612(+)